MDDVVDASFPTTDTFAAKNVLIRCRDTTADLNMI